jgi:diaminopimelate epimerase
MMRIAKAHAYGNDFLYVEKRAVDGARLQGLELLTRELCDRHRGIGADGLIVYERTAAGAAMQLFNADGGRAEVSGNGVRGLAALLLNDDQRNEVEIAVETEGGQKRLRRVGRMKGRQTFRAAMGLPVDLRKASIAAAGETLEVIVMTLGNPQCVVLGPLPQHDRFRRLGEAIERHEMFPAATNVEFAEVESSGQVRILIWERGVGPTFSSGTGSCAALVAASAFGGAAREAEVIAPGGAQRVEWREDSVYLTGWAEVVLEGDWLRPLPGAV